MIASPPPLRRVIANVARTDLRRLLNDRTALFFTVALPLMIIYIIGLAFGDEDFRPEVGIADLDATPAAAALAGQLPDRLDPVVFTDADALTEAVRGADVFAGLVIPAGFADALAGGGDGVEVTIVTDATRTGSASVAALLQGAADSAARRAAVARAVADDVDLEGPALADRLAELDTTASGVTVTTVGAPSTEVGTSDFGLEMNRIAAGNLVLFVFITSLAASGIIIRARRLGIGRRALAAPVRPGHVLLGFAAGRFAIAAFQALVIVIAGALLFDVAWGDPVAAFVLILALTVAGTGAGLVAATIFRTEDQAGSVGPPVGIALGMLGGCMWPLEIVPAPMRAIGHLTPHAWAMDGFADLFERGEGLGGIGLEVGVLVGVAALLVTIGLVRIGPRLAGTD